MFVALERLGIGLDTRLTRHDSAMPNTLIPMMTTVKILRVIDDYTLWVLGVLGRLPTVLEYTEVNVDAADDSDSDI